jgi:hypothetical protein
MNKLELVGMAVLIVGTFLFGRAYHDLDLSANLINQAIMTEQGTFGVLSNTSIYLNGMQEMLFSHIMLIMGCMVILGSKLNVIKHDQRNG